MAPGKGWLDWLLSEERRQGRRRKSLPLVAYYWDGANPVAHQVRDASSSGLYLMTEHRWYPGTVLAMTLQHTAVDADDPQRAIAVNARVIRTGDDGVGFEFILPEKAKELQQLSGMPAPLINKKRMKTFLDRVGERKIGDTKGQSLIEFALALPLIFLLILNVVNFGGFFYAWITVSDAARAGANYAVLGGAAAGHQTQPSLSTMTSIITTDASSLPNSASLTVTACEYPGGGTKALTYTAAITPGGTTACSFTLNADPESNYSIVEVKVQYTYQPFFAAFSFPKLGVHLTIPPTAITQSAQMRVIQ
jgi:Flp pilus assembly protein TadG